MKHETDPTCAICGRPVSSEGRQVKGRWFCTVHLDKPASHRTGVWWAGLAQLGALLALVLLLEVFLAFIPVRLEGSWLIVAGIFLALVPSMLWLGFFYQQDRLEPEPKGYVLGVFVLGALLAAAIGLPLVRDVFRVGDWFGQGSLYALAGSILAIGFSQEFLKYAAVRYSVFGLAEFDERTDGIVYGTAAGLGFATILNLDFILNSGGLNLDVGVIAVVVTALAQACFAGISGYFLARAKLERRPWWWLPLGLALAAVGNGIFTFLRGEVGRSAINLEGGGGFNLWPGLLLATAVTLVVFLLLNWLIRRDIAVTLKETAHS
ncbi:MAG: PrsW family glutamic-type intramembrane protease [bacterium]